MFNPFSIGNPYQYFIGSIADWSDARLVENFQSCSSICPSGIEQTLFDIEAAENGVGIYKKDYHEEGDI
jgi:putative ubiquitin-RnfH superfamily antitoxin RatB of RatAB toxin-antitoxin module